MNDVDPTERAADRELTLIEIAPLGLSLRGGVIVALCGAWSGVIGGGLWAIKLLPSGFVVAGGGDGIDGAMIFILIAAGAGAVVGAASAVQLGQWWLNRPR